MVAVYMVVMVVTVMVVVVDELVKNVKKFVTIAMHDLFVV